MRTFNHKNQKRWIGLHLIGILLICAGLIILITSFFIGQETDRFTLFTMVGLSIVLGIIVISTFRGTLIDFKTSKIKIYQAILWVKIGNWNTLPSIDKVDMIIHSYKTSNFRNGISPTLSYQVTVYKVVLLSKNTVVLDFDYSSQEKASSALEVLKSGLDME